VQLHEEYQLDPPFIDPLHYDSSTIVDDAKSMDNNDSPTLLELEQLLEEYHTLVSDTNINKQHALNDDEMLLMDESNQYYYEKDHAYEANIHMSLGEMYTEVKKASTSSITQATFHFEKAVRLYEIEGDEQNTNVALAKYNLFLLHLRDGDYRTAMRWYDEAIDLLEVMNPSDELPADWYYELNDLSWISGRADLQNDRNTQSQHQQKSTRSHQEQQRTSLHSDASASDTATKAGSSVKQGKRSKQLNIRLTTKNTVGSSIYINLQHYLSQNDTHKEEL
jgi:tetratricopeptide (TPR) repeat protein